MPISTYSTQRYCICNPSRSEENLLEIGEIMFGLSDIPHKRVHDLNPAWRGEQAISPLGPPLSRLGPPRNEAT